MWVDLATARYCYVSFLRKNVLSKSLSVEELDPKDNSDRASLVKELVPIVLNDELPDRVIFVNSLLNPKPRKGLIQFLRENQDVFTWCHKDMLGIDPRIMPYRLNVNPYFRPI